MSVAYYYFNAQSSSGWSDPANMVDGSTSTYAYLHANKSVGPNPDIENEYCNSNNCAGTSLGRITKVELRCYWEYNIDSGNTNPRAYVNATPYFNGSAGSLHTLFDTTSLVDLAPAWSSWSNITSSANHPTWGTNWNDIKNIDVNMHGYARTGTDAASLYTYLLVFYIQMAVTYTPYAASTGSISSPSASAVNYRAGSGLAINGTAANAVGVNKVQHKVDSGSWVDCTGTTSWSATIPQSSLSTGAHTIYIQVQEQGSGTWTAVDNVAITQSNIPSGVI